MRTITIPMALDPKPMADPQLDAALKRRDAAVKKLQDTGIIDAEGRRIRTDLPADMEEGSDRDFGG